jgi:outer membrane protein
MKKYFALGLLLVVSTAYAQEQLTFEQAVTIGLAENVNLKNSRNNLYSSKSQKTTAQMAFLPNLNLSASGGQTKGQQINQVTGQGFNSTNDAFFGSLNTNVGLFQGNARINSLKETKFRLASQQAFVSRTQQDVVYNVSIQFLQVLLDQELEKIAGQNLESQLLILQEIAGFVEAGARPEADRYTQEADVSNFELLVIQAQNRLLNDKASLAQLLQLDPSDEFDVVNPGWTIMDVTPDDYVLDSLYTIAIKNRADLQQFKYNEMADLHASKRAIAGYLPTVSLGASYSSQYSNPNIDSFLIPSFSEQFTELNPQFQYGFQVSIPIFDRLTTRNDRVNAKMRYENSINNRTNLEKSIKLEVKRAYLNFIDVARGYEVSISQVDASKLAYDTQSESYNVGIATQVERANANQTYVTALADWAQIRYRLLFQSIMLDYATGILTVEGISN